MRTLHATGRLLWRPAILIALFPLALVTALALLDFTSESMAVAGPGTDAARHTLWRFATLVPAAVGLLISLLTRELQHTLFAWTLPALSRKLLLGKLFIGGIFAGAVALASIPFSDAQLSLALFGWSLLSFAIGGVVFDPVRSKVEAYGAALIVAALAFRPLYADSMMELQPLVAGPLAAFAALALVQREFGRSLSAERPLTFMSPTWSLNSSASRQYWARRATNDAEWTRSLHRGRSLDWILAGAHESFGARRGGYAAYWAIQITIVVIMSYLTDNPGMAAMFPWIIVGMTGLQLSSRLTYPIDRSERASLFFMSSVADTIAASTAGLVSIALLFVIGPRTQWMGGGQPFGDTLMSLAFFAAFSPIGHWAKTRGSYSDQVAKSARSALRYFAFQLPFMFLAVSVAMPMEAFSLAIRMGTASVAFVLIHGAFWLALRRHFGTKDLVVTR